ncbi:MAG: tetratricopeptide repeat protein [Parvularculales bacterium]
MKWYRHAADQGFAQAQFNLGNMFRAGEGVPQDKEQALTLYKQAAEQGLAQAQANLGVMYYQGTGVLQDYVYAHMWLNIAVSNGNKRARKLRETITQISSPNQIEKVQALARECVRKNYQGC